MKQTKKDSNGTSHFGITIDAKVQDLFDLLGDPQFFENDGTDKVNMEWILETNDGIVFTLYDWKEGGPLLMDEIVTFNIGGYFKMDCYEGFYELNQLLKTK
jgi:hypothetical protein